MDEIAQNQINQTVVPEIQPTKKWKTPFIMVSCITCILFIFIVFLLTSIPCGGFIGSQCPLGLTCKHENNYADALGYCAIQLFPSSVKTLPKTIPNIPTPTPSLEPTITQESTPTANWKTYKNSMFSIKYPADFQVDELGTGINFINKTMNVRIVIKFESTLLNINDYIDQKSWCTSIKSNTGTPYLLDSVSSLRYEKTPCGLTGSTDIYSLYNGTAYHISIDTQENYTDNILLINQILSTFKFLDNPIDINIPGTESSFSGTIKKTVSRPAPDIAYDYEIILDRPLVGITTGAGENQTIEKIIIQGKEFNLEKYIDKHINFLATLEWGLAESRVLHVTKIIDSN